MKAMIFAAGLGTRLKPLTDCCPKALVPIGGKPMLEHLILKLKSAGFDYLVINIHHFGEQIVDFLVEHENFGLRISVSDERGELLDTGGGIKKAIPLLEGPEPVLVHNVDIVSDVDLAAFYRSHAASGADASLLVSERVTSRYLLFDDICRLKGWQNRSTGEVKSCFPDFRPELYRPFAFGGVHVISPSVFRAMDKWNGKFSIIDFYLSLAGKADITACLCPGMKWMDIGKSETLKEAEKWMYEKDR